MYSIKMKIYNKKILHRWNEKHWSLGLLFRVMWAEKLFYLYEFVHEKETENEALLYLTDLLKDTHYHKTIIAH